MSFIRKFKKNGKIYLAEVESRREKGKIVQRFIRYVGKEVDGKTILSTSISNAQVDEVKLYGPLIALNYLAEEINLKEHLGVHAEEILSLVYAHCIDFRSINQMESWFKRTDLNMILGLEDLTERKLLNAMDFIEKTNQEDIQKNIFKSVREKYSLSNSGVIYDVTNTYLYGKKCSFAKPGHDKEGVKGRPLIQIGLGVTKDEGIPVFHKTFDGNIHDSKTLHDLITTFRRYGLKSGLLVYDRGITSGRNLADINSLKWDTVCGVAINQYLKIFWRTTLRKAASLDIKDRVQLNDSVFYVTKKPYSIDGVKGDLYLCFNPRQQLDLKDYRRSEIVTAQQLKNNGKSIKPPLEKFFNKKGQIIATALRKAEEFNGYSCIFSTHKITKSQIVKLYFDKDIVEKAFRSLKGTIKLRPIRHWLHQRVQAHVFICYLAYLLLSLLKLHLKKLDISPEKALSELDSMYKVFLRDTKNNLSLTRIVTLTKKQEKILKAINPALLKLAT